MRLTEAEIKANRVTALQTANPGPTTSTTTVQGALVSGQSTTTTVPVVIAKPPKKIFTIVSWNIQDYKGSKITDDSKAWVHAFVKLLVESLAVDLLLLIETDVDLTEAAARIELADHQNWGSELATSRCDFHLAASGRSFKKVELPAKFTLDDLQKDKQTPSENCDWREEIEAFFYTYEVTYKNARIDYPTLKQLILGGKSYNPGDVRFKRSSDCPACAGAGCVCAGQKTCKYCTCTECNQQHDAYLACGACKCATCDERGIVDRPCTFCGGKDRGCMMCGGVPTVELWCPDCHCTTCRGEGTLESKQRQACPTCNGAKSLTITCPKCQGKRGHLQPCGNCQGGAHPFAKACQPCGGRGQVAVPCDACGGAGQGQQACGDCGGAGTKEIVVTTDCPRCGGAGRLSKLKLGQQCTACEGVGTTHVRCLACADARCPACGGEGEPNSDAWTHAIETASLLLKAETFGTYDVETYTAMWRTPKHRLPSQYGVGHEACDRKLAWLCTGSTLCSTDKNGAELGYQDLNGDFNCRSPFTMPLWLSLDGQHVQVPMAALHAIWGKSTSTFVKARGASVEKMLSLAVAYPGADLENLGDYANPLLVGDFNLNYKIGTTAEASRAINKLIASGYRTTTSATQTSLSMLSAGMKKVLAAKPDKNKLYSAAYDHFLLKTGSALNQHVVQAGVIDILDMAKRLIAGNSTLAAQIDADAAATHKTKNGTTKAKKKTQIFDLSNAKDKDLARAFYLYRKYVSDHIPILIDILVDTQDAKQAEWRDGMLQQGHDLRFRLGQQPPPPPQVPSYEGHWTEGKFVFTGPHSLKVDKGGSVVHVCGRVIRWRRDKVTVRVSQLDDQGKETWLHIDFVGTHTIDPEILRDFRTVGVVWLQGVFTVARAPDQIFAQPKGQTPEPPAFWRAK
ncbi:hypothetical protein [Nannocystis punicea]|uniref:TNFR-Cys domain-containing protein n=1 Tax=Nannocystis punicea TaxID=2995304 RepID=A0ABY7HIX6_9BACT|nr:hypothetical protein [Nannocystis poenicansa]WAS99282.1 hypothetical protein O0S08_24405 [Nannocystis poenicansa]